MIGNNGMVSGTVRTLYVIVPVPSMKMILKDTIKILNNENDFILVQMPISIYVYIIYYNIMYIYIHIYIICYLQTVPFRKNPKILKIHRTRLSLDLSHGFFQLAGILPQFYFRNHPTRTPPKFSAPCLPWSLLKGFP